MGGSFRRLDCSRLGASLPERVPATRLARFGLRLFLALRPPATHPPDAKALRNQQHVPVFGRSCVRKCRSVWSAAVSTSASARTVYISQGIPSASRTQYLSVFA